MQCICIGHLHAVSCIKHLGNRKNPPILDSDYRSQNWMFTLQNFTRLYIFNMNIKQLRYEGVWFSHGVFLFDWLIDFNVGRGYVELTWKRSLSWDHKKKVLKMFSKWLGYWWSLKVGWLVGLFVFVLWGESSREMFRWWWFFAVIFFNIFFRGGGRGREGVRGFFLLFVCFAFLFFSVEFQYRLSELQNSFENIFILWKGMPLESSKIFCFCVQFS